MSAAFWILSALALIGALLAVTLRNLVHCVLSLILFFLGIAGHYFLLRADFLGAVQILIVLFSTTALVVGLCKVEERFLVHRGKLTGSV